MRSPFVSPLSGKKTLSRFVTWTSWRPIRMARRVPAPQITLRGEGDRCARAQPCVCRLPSHTRRLAQALLGMRLHTTVRGRSRHLTGAAGAPTHAVTITRHGEVAEWTKAAPC